MLKNHFGHQKEAYRFKTDVNLKLIQPDISGFNSILLDQKPFLDTRQYQHQEDEILVANNECHLTPLLYFQSFLCTKKPDRL